MKTFQKPCQSRKSRGEGCKMLISSNCLPANPTHSKAVYVIMQFHMLHGNP